jgi:redox-sensitive bicupin YhaK (pirin superfamily)
MSVLPDFDPECIDCANNDVVDLIIEARPRSVGTFTVARVLPSPKRRLIGPFIFIDRGGPVTIAPGAPSGIGPHPHIGLSTLTYMFEGEIVHRDSTGSVQVIRPGDVNLMTAGRGIVHSERPDPSWQQHGGTFDAVQIWLALPLENEDDTPLFEHYAKTAFPALAETSNVRGHLLAGSAFGLTSPLLHPSRPLLVDLELDANAVVELPRDAQERGVLVIAGSVELGGVTLHPNQLAALREGAAVSIRAAEQSRVLVIGGPHLGDRLMDWNFVASTRERLERARDAWQAQTFPKIPGDDKDFIPYPEHHR